MRTAIFDLETSGFYADSNVLLCAVIREYEYPLKSGKYVKRTVLRGDEVIPNWSKKRSNDKALIEAVLRELEQYDVLVAHNGQYFDKAFLNAKCLEHGFSREVAALKRKKFIDPVLLARKHLKLGRNTLAAIIDYFQIPVKKTPLELSAWRKAAFDGDMQAMNLIVDHCIPDVDSLALVYDRMRPLIEKVDNRGSSL